jgi:hypothetical protein
MQSQVGQHANGVVRLVDGSEIAGEWDEARVVGCCTLMARRGDRPVRVDVTGPNTITLIQARDYAARHRPRRVNACTLLPRPEAEALIGALTGDPKSRGDSCIYPRPSSTGTYWEEAELSVDWQGGLRRLRDSTAVGIRFDTTANSAWELSGARVGPGLLRGEARRRDLSSHHGGQTRADPGSARQGNVQNFPRRTTCATSTDS